MLRILTLILSITALSQLQAQKQDNIWLFGYDYNSGGLKEGVRFRFDDSLIISYEERTADFASTSAFISDSTGNLLLYSNGCYISNADGGEVQGSSGLNPGTMYNIFCAGDVGYNIPQGMMAVPHSTDSFLYYFFHFLVTGSISKNLLYTLVDVSANNGQGITISKNQLIISDTIAYDGMHAVKHANGRDWWVIAAKEYSNKYYLVLLSPQGVIVKEQIVGESTLSGAGGQITFSPDGTKLARFNTRDDLRIFNFDRCTGTLSNPVFIPVEDNADNELYAGLAWSADGRYLYAAEVKRILQFDTWAANIAASKTIVAEKPPSPSPNFAYLELGPDGYIYCRPLGGQFFMHRIKHPEREGLACEVQQSYYELEYPYVNLPHFPNFRLGPIDGSSCDTLGLDNHPLAGWRYDKTGGLGVDFTSVSWYEPVNWWWDFGDIASGTSDQSNEHNPAHNFSAPGAYEVCLTVSNQYGSDTKCKWVWVSTVGSSSPQETTDITVYPNPSTGQIFWTGLEGQNLHVRVFNALGQLVADRNTPGNSLDLSALPEGVYQVQFSSLETKLLLNRSLVIQKR